MINGYLVHNLFLAMMMTLKIFLILTFSTLYVSEGARCKKSLGRLSCNPCSKGARCFWCSWCTGYCYNGRKARKDTQEIEYGSVEAPYKVPFLDLFDDLEALINGDGISEYDVLDLYKCLSVVTREDCTICNDSTELNAFSNFAAKVNDELKNYTGTILFKSRAMYITTETKIIVQNLPNSLTIKVDPDSSILESVKGII